MNTAKRVRPHILSVYIVAACAILAIVVLPRLACYSAGLVEQLRKSEANAAAAMEQVEVASELIERYKETCKQHEEQNIVLEARCSELESTNEALLESLSLYQGTVVASNPTPPRYIDCPLDADLQSYIWSLCSNYDIEEKYELVYAMIKCESQFDAAAISYSNDYGLMQINAINHETLSSLLGITDFLDPYQNVHAGIYMIASLLHKYDLHDALMAYNMGENGASKLWRRGIHDTTYTDQVLDYYYQFTGDI